MVLQNDEDAINRGLLPESDVLNIQDFELVGVVAAQDDDYDHTRYDDPEFDDGKFVSPYGCPY